MNWVLPACAVGGIALGVGALGFVLWTLCVYEPKRKQEEAANTRLFECLLARQFIECAATEKGREEILHAILTQRPTMPSWPEWSKVWGTHDPLRPDTLH